MPSLPISYLWRNPCQISPFLSFVCCSPSSLRSSEERNFLSDGELYPSQCEKCIVNARDNTCPVDSFNLKGMPVDAKTFADHQECKHSICRSVMKYVFFKTNDSVVTGSESNEPGEAGNLKVKREKDRSNQLLALSLDIPFPKDIPISDHLECLQNSVLLPFISHGQIESVSSHAEFDCCRDSTVAMQRSTTLSVATPHNFPSEMNLPDKTSRSCNVCISRKQLSKVDCLSNQRERNQLNSMKKPQTEVVPGWRKPPRPPRQAKHEANSTHSNSVSDVSHTYRVNKLQRLHGKKKVKVGGCALNITFFLALVFTFCFSLLIASSRR